LIQKDRLPDLFSWRLTPADAAWAAAQRRDEQLPPEDVTD